MAARPPLNDVQKRYKRRSWLISLAAAIPMIGIMVLIKPLLPERPVRPDDMAAIAAGAMMLMMGILMIIGNFASPKDAPVPRARLAQLVSVLLGAAGLFLPILGGSFIDPWVNFSLVMVLSVVSWAASWMVWRHADELMRSLMRDTAVVGFYVITVALWIYAVGERLGLFSGVSAWGMLAIATIMTIGASVWTSVRRGLDRPPAEE
jgi:uncharacterized membrane protein HdeD (DUF308 family)